jgi:SPP1 family predicted phage head-tail adaptor
MIQAGQFRHVVQIEAQSTTLDDYGQQSLQFVPIHTGVRAQIVPLSGREYVSARQVMAEVTTRVTIRHVDGVEPTMRLTHPESDDSPAELAVYDILAVLPDPVSGRRYLTLMCARRYAQGFRRGE